jgi:23S rRNA pseudouridine1911/1915/1917 synthase
MNAEPENNKSEEEEELVYEKYRVRADPKQSLLRIDKFLMDRLNNVTRNRLQTGIKSGLVLVNGQSVKPNYKIKPNDEVVVTLPEAPKNTDIIPQDIPIEIIYEDKDLLVVNKEAGMVVHPAIGNWDGTLINALVYHFQNLPKASDNAPRPGLVHRIDKFTSGLLLIAKTEMAQAHLAKQFFDKKTERTYYALIWGEPKEDKGSITGYIGRSTKNRKLRTVYDDESKGKWSVTHYEVIERFRYVTLVKCNLETGRTHQIRVHFQSLGHPLFGDFEYGGDKIMKGTRFSKYKQFVENCFKLMPGQALHAKTLGFVHPGSKKWIQLDSDLPAHFQELLEKWRNYVQYSLDDE